MSLKFGLCSNGLKCQVFRADIFSVEKDTDKLHFLACFCVNFLPHYSNFLTPQESF